MIKSKCFPAMIPHPVF